MFLTVLYKFLPSSSSKPPQFKTSQKAIEPVLAVCSMLSISARSYAEWIISGFNAGLQVVLPGTSENRNVLRCNTCIHKNTFNLKSAENILHSY